MTSTNLAKRETVRELVAIYTTACETIRSSFSAIAKAENAVNQAFTKDNCVPIRIGDRYQRHVNFEDPKITITNLQRDCWRTIVERLEIRKVLSIARSEELNRQLEKGDLPEITVENVFEFANAYVDNLHTALEETFLEVFELLCPRGKSRYKTNSDCEIGSKVVLPSFIEEGWHGCFRLSHYYEHELAAIENAFKHLAGLPVGTANSYYSDIKVAIEKTQISNGRGETNLFKFRCCKNKSLHLEFKNLHSVQRLNQIVGGLRLKK